jgi:hypothetical protein
MSFDDTSNESRERFSEALLLLNHITATSPQGLGAASEVDKAMRGLWLVSLYGAFERSINATVEQSIIEISSHKCPSSACIPPIYSIFHHSHIQSVKDCGYKAVFDKSLALFEAVSGRDPLNVSENPLSGMLQNVDMGTVMKVKSYFGTPMYKVEQENAGRLNNLS